MRKNTRKTLTVFCEFVAQSTPPSSHRIRTIRRQSSIGAYQESAAAAAAPVTIQTVPQTHTSVPLSSSTSYYTNSPSPPHLAGTILDTVPSHQHADELLVPLDTNQPHILQHSTVLDTHSDSLVINRNQFEHINAKLDQLNKRIHTLETTLVSDVRNILSLLQAQYSASEVSTIKQEVC